MQIQFQNIGQAKKQNLKYAVIITLYKNKWIFVKHKDRDTWEIPGGRREIDEDINDTAKRELFEETGALNFQIKPVCDYCVIRNDEASYGRLFYAEVEELGALPDLEIEKIELFDKLPEKLTYPDIQPLLYRRVVAEMTNIRKAKPTEANTLTDIAVKSESYWGFDSDFMESFKSIYKVTEDFINTNPTFVMEKGEYIVGFYSILASKDEASLEYFYIEPQFIGKGYGRLLWEHMLESCKNLGIKGVEIVTSPEAAEFYIKMGAIQIGKTESLVRKGRKIPKLYRKC